nr:B3 domain-containing protein REM10-like [Ipomoea batatas]
MPSKLNTLSSKSFAAAMKTIPPKNPHFIKPIHQGFKNGVDIPTYFLAKYLKGQGPKFAILRRGDRSWRVKISGGRILGDGWEKFAADNGLNVGDVVVFRQEGDSVFDVSVFEPSLCEKDCPLPHGGTPLLFSLSFFVSPPPPPPYHCLISHLLHIKKKKKKKKKTPQEFFLVNVLSTPVFAPKDTEVGLGRIVACGNLNLVFQENYVYACDGTN